MRGASRIGRRKDESEVVRPAIFGSGVNVQLDTSRPVGAKVHSTSGSQIEENLTDALFPSADKPTRRLDDGLAALRERLSKGSLPQYLQTGAHQLILKERQSLMGEPISAALGVLSLGLDEAQILGRLDHPRESDEYRHGREYLAARH